MSFRSMLKDKVTLIKKDGRRFEDIRASVQRDKIFTADANIPIEEGDVFERALPNSIVERYTILDAGYYAATGGIPANYQSVVRKQTKIDPVQPIRQVVYNVTGPNARINIQSVDNSSNLVQVEPTELFERLRDAIRQVVTDGTVSAELVRKVDELQETQGTSSFATKYQEFMALAANHITVLAPFIPALSQMLG